MRRWAAALLATATILGAGCNTDPREAYTTVPRTVPPTGPTTPAPTGTCTAEPSAPTTKAYAEVEGVDPDLLSVDVYELPAQCGPRPVLFWVHGGGWMVGDKGNQIDDKVALAATYGWVLVSVNYRLSSPGAGVQWPTHGNDVAAAMAYTLDHADDFGIDPEHVAVMGHSSGAHLAAIVTVDPALLKAAGHSRNEIACMVLLDTEGYSITALIDEAPEADVLRIEAIFGEDFTTLQQASPNFVLSQQPRQTADALVVTRGDLERQALAVDFADLVKATGANAEMVFADGYSHEEVNDAVGLLTDQLINPAVTTFLSGCLG